MHFSRVFTFLHFVPFQTRAKSFFVACNNLISNYNLLMQKNVTFSSNTCNFYSRKHLSCFMAETEGFEPSIRFPVYTLSRRASSTTRASLLFLCLSFPHR